MEKERKTQLICAAAATTVVTGVGVYYWLKHKNSLNKKKK